MKSRIRSLLQFVSLAAMSVLPCQAQSEAIQIDPNHPHSFRYTSGEWFFPMGDTAYFLIAQPTNVIARFIDVRRVHKFNFIRAMAMAPGFWPFGGTPAKPDYSQIDETALRKWDWVFDYAAARAMNIELILWGYGTAGGEGIWTRPEVQKVWIETLVRRFKDRPNLFMFTIANEFERYPDGKYQYSTRDVEWARDVAASIRALDAFHPIGCHPSVWITDRPPKGFHEYKGFTQILPPVIWPLWEGSAINLNITQNNEGAQPRTWGNLDHGQRGLTYYSTNSNGTDYPAVWTSTGWRFEAAELEDSIAADWAHGKPVLNTEFGYQYEPGYQSDKSYLTRQSHQPATVRKKAWKTATSGGYFATGFIGTAVRDFTERDIENFRPQQLETLYTFFTERTRYWKLAPRLDLVASRNSLLALTGEEYIAYFPRGGTNSLRLEAGSYHQEWLHPETGSRFAQKDLVASKDSHLFSPPGNPGDDWILHLWRE